MRNLKKVISSVAALAIVASSASAFAITFPDVEESASYANAVNALAGLGVINGDDNGLFNPENSVTRAEFTKMAVEALGDHDAATSQTTSQFADAANTDKHWAAGYIAQGVSRGFINGYDDRTFGPDDQVTYAQACKMLVAAIGYTTYAENQGGWPTGYVAQASTLGISKGVTANNDTNLTRQQVAILIYNAMQVPLCVIDSWKSETTLTGVVQVPELKRLDGKENRDYQTLLTDKHDAYVVKGRVTVTSKGGSAAGLEKDEVTYAVESADNFDDYLNIAPANLNTQTQTMKVGDTNAANMLFEYTEALVQKDVDADEYTILAITSYGNSKTVTIDTDEVADDDSVIGTNYVANGKLPVYKSETSSSTTKYDLATNARMYVNGVDAGLVEDDKIINYIIKNNTGKVTLIDVTNTGSTSTDGKYEYLMVDYYVDAVVESVQTTSTYARVYFKASQAAQRMQWDPDDDDIDITFSGDATSYTDLQEYDVLSIAYDVVNNGDALTDLEYYDVKVSRNTVSGTVSSRDNTDGNNIVKIDGSEYDVIDLYDVGSDVELSTEYTLYLDAFGYVAYIDEGNSDKNYGVIVAMYTSSGNDYPTVRMITSDAQVVAYECKDDVEAKKFYEYATGKVYGTDGTSFTKSTNSANIKAGKTVCTYKLSGGKLRFDKAFTGDGGTELEYKANQSKLGKYTIAEGVTKIIDMDNYMSESNSGSTVSTLALSTFEDEAQYDAYLFDKNNNGDYRFAIVFGGTSSIRSESTMAIVQSVVGTTDVDGTTCTELKVARDGQEDISVLVEGDDVASEGSVIAYVVGSDGYVESGDLYVLMNAGSSYAGQMTALLDNNYENFSGAIMNAKKIEGGRYDGFATPKYASTTSKDVVLYYGIVYRKTANNLDLFTSATSVGGSKISSVSDDVQTFSVSGANQYVYDFGQKAKYRVSVGSQTQANTIFNPAYCTETGAADTANDKNYVSWDRGLAEDTTPAMALVKEVDGDVIDVMYFVAP
ncbi:MAG: S-layer homology domain-containing protein [Oscillospiraceae bacterium]|nr:S-layer homology domain-containing protein [Oscillospiraceae bacterium]